MEERRGINRVDYVVKSVIVTCDTFEKFVVEAANEPAWYGADRSCRYTQARRETDYHCRGYIDHVCGRASAGGDGRRTIPDRNPGKKIHSNGTSIFV